jgi:hypothetical protein
MMLKYPQPHFPQIPSDPLSDETGLAAGTAQKP